MYNKLNWTLFSNRDRNETINDLKDIISKNNGWIVTSNFFSDLAVSITIEIQEKDIICLHSELNRFMNVSELKYDNIDENSEKEWWVFFNITFTQGTGDLINEIPAVPG